MRPSSHSFAAGAWFIGAGAALAAYPILRPYAGGGAPDGSTQLASGAWPLAHVLGMVGFVAIAFGLRTLAGASRAAWPVGAARRAETFAWAAVAFLLPYYGAEAFGLHALGQYAAAHSDTAVLAVVDSFRYAPLPMTLFGIGLVLLAVTGVLIARGAWAGGVLSRLGGVVVAVGLVTYLPQFFGPAPVRMAHGLMLGLGLALLGIAVARTPELDGAAGDDHSRRTPETAPSAH